jgi:tight adherence protein B
METYYAVLLIVFAAAALAVEGGFAFWDARHGPEAKRIARRLRVMATGDRGEEAISVLKTRHWDTASATERFLLDLPGGRKLDKLLLQAGFGMTLTQLTARSLMLFLIGFGSGWLIVQVLIGAGNAWAMGLILGLVAATLPTLSVLRAKHKRMQAFLYQLPEALDLVGRAMRAGHAFSGGVKMVADEMRPPIGSEFRIAFEELNLGLSVDNAMLNLSERVDVPDLKFFVVAVLIQRESGGNLAEILDRISKLIRERIRLFGRVRVLATQGRLEAWILSVLPFVVAAVIFALAPEFISVLWTEQVGRIMLAVTSVMMVFGIFVMWRMVHIRV